MAFEALAHLRAGRPDRALEVAEAGLAPENRYTWRRVLLAVRFEVLRRRGHPATLEPDTLLSLERLGYHDWVRNLGGLGGAPAPIS